MKLCLIFLAAITAPAALPATSASYFDSTSTIVMPPVLSSPSSGGGAAADDNVGGHIVGGEDAAKGEFPYYATPTGENGICGGALIATNIILTAAHCTWSEKTGADVLCCQVMM
jgi:secreted trypsin-like serine protease